MSFADIFKKAFLEGYAGDEINAVNIIVALAICTAISLFIFFVYRYITKDTFYSKSFAISLICVSIITASIIFTIQSNVVISLGMVGALSIVRFRTAIKEPMDLAFLFWSISVGIICGAGLAELAIILSLFVTVILFALTFIPITNRPMLLVLDSEDLDMEEKVDSVLKKYTRRYTVKSRNINKTHINLVIELRIREQSALVRELANLDYLDNISLLSHDGEATF